MKKQILLLLMCMIPFLGNAKDLKTLRVTTQPQMTCSNCENKIKKSIRFEKGIHQITTNLENQVVTVVYDADKTDEEKIIKAFDKIKYRALRLEDGCNGVATDSCGGCCRAKTDKK